MEWSTIRHRNTPVMDPFWLSEQEYHNECYEWYVVQRWRYCPLVLHSVYPVDSVESERICFVCQRSFSSFHEFIHNGKKRKPIGRCCLPRYLPSATSTSLTPATPTPALYQLIPWMKQKLD